MHIMADLLIALQIEACDLVLGKIGYGTTSEVLATNTPLVFVRRSDPALRCSQCRMWCMLHCLDIF